MVVDDSLTVRRVTERLLLREGYRVVTAKDGLDALERLAEERPLVLLSDIEMPRMDGFDLVRNVRADPRLAELPVIMITSRIAQKHRDYADELGRRALPGQTLLRGRVAVAGGPLCRGGRARYPDLSTDRRPGDRQRCALQGLAKAATLGTSPLRRRCRHCGSRRRLSRDPPCLS